MMEAGGRAPCPRCGRRLLAITILTSHDDETLGRDRGRTGRWPSPCGGSRSSPATRARTASWPRRTRSGSIREACGRGFLIVTPGIRPSGAAAGDQARAATPAAALAAGADYLVVGRPITEAADPGAAADAIVREMGVRSRRR